MAASSVAVVILAAGGGTRMNSHRPKVLHEIAGRPMLGYVLDAAKALKPKRLVVVTGHRRDQVETYLKTEAPKAKVAEQTRRLGTGHAVGRAKKALGDFSGTVVVLYGDGPLVTGEGLKRLLKAHKKGTLTFLGFHAARPAGYGRLVMRRRALEMIVEEADATRKEKAIRFCNSGIVACEAKALFRWLAALKNDNARGEYYLTDIASLAAAEGKSVGAAEGPEEEFLGVNRNREKARAEAAMQARLRGRAMDGGVTLIDPEAVHFSHDTRLAAGVVVWPNVVFGPGVSVGKGAVIHSFCHLEGASVGKNASVGPFARLRPGAVIGEGAKIGNFVEVKKSTVGKGAKVNHLSYVGDAKVGKNANIGAGTITCNYDGFKKHVTVIGEGAFIGSNAALVAPVTIGKNAIVGAGSVITKNVPAEAMAIARGKETILKGAAKRYRKRRTGKRK
jgi:bifunctional UDP-N-acetylglucosamine pyrophosphorylase / glucosamine-1-phosphate N-acetyltransferase